MQKPGRLVIEINALKSSDAYDREKYPDYVFGWYMKLLIEQADNTTRPGYLPNDLSKLWKLAGAKSQPYFESWGGCELVKAKFNRTEDGEWIYHPRVLKQVEDFQETALLITAAIATRSDTKKAKPLDIEGLVVLSATEVLLKEAFERAWRNYPKKTEKPHAEKQYAAAIARICKGEQGERMTSDEAVTWLNERIIAYSLAMNGVEKCFVCNFGTFVGKQKKRYMDDQEAWRRGSGEQKQRPRTTREALEQARSAGR